MRNLVLVLIVSLAVVAFGGNHPYISDYGTLLEGFENVDDWTVKGTGATAVNDTSLVQEENQSIKLNAVDGNSAQLIKSGLTLDLSTGNGFSFSVYIDDISKYNSFVYFFTSADYTKYFYKNYSNLTNGWNKLVIAKSEFTNTGDYSWNDTIASIIFRLNPVTGENASVNLDDLRFGIVGQAKVILTFDNIIDDHMKAFQIMEDNGQRGAELVYSNGVGKDGRMTLANLITLRDAGWDLCNHTAAHLNLTVISQAEMETDIDDCYDWLVANGFGNTAKFFSYPMGAFNDAVVAKVKERHVLARAVSGEVGRGHFEILNYHDLQFKLSAYAVKNTVSVATFKAEIDMVIERGGLLIPMFHGIVDTDAVLEHDYLTADFQAISDYLKIKQNAGLLEVITFSDYYNALIELEPSCPEEPEMDFNDDCRVDFADFALFIQGWLECNLDPAIACWE